MRACVKCKKAMVPGEQVVPVLEVVVVNFGLDLALDAAGAVHIDCLLAVRDA